LLTALSALDVTYLRSAIFTCTLAPWGHYCPRSRAQLTPLLLITL